MFFALWASIALFALLGILRPEAAAWLPVSGSLYTLGGAALVVGAALPTTMGERTRLQTLALAIIGLWVVLTAVQFIAFLGRPGASVPMFLGNFLKWGSALAIAAYAASFAAITAVVRFADSR